MNFDEKERIMLNHYKKIIEEREFDEYDILGFLIFVREKLNKGNLNFIPEFADLVAHRKRNKGIVMNNIIGAIKNGYAIKNHKVQGYQGINWESWQKEWNRLALELGININNDIIIEITICIYSLAQYTKYDDANGCSGKIELFVDGTTNSLCLCTTEGHGNSFFVCLAKFGNFNINKSLFDSGHIKEPVETLRTKDKLILKCSKGNILEVNCN